MDSAVNQAMEMKIDGMIEFNKTSKKYLNNPAQKETDLKTRKDKPELSTITQPGYFYAFIPQDFRVGCDTHGGNQSPDCGAYVKLS